METRDRCLEVEPVYDQRGYEIRETLMNWYMLTGYVEQYIRNENGKPFPEHVLLHLLSLC